jgi:hypothetical protein
MDEKSCEKKAFIHPITEKEPKQRMESLSLQLQKNNMSIAVKKIELIEWLTRLQDEKSIKKVEGLRKELEADWWSTLTAEQREDIEAGIADLEAGRKKDFKKVLSKYR